MIHEIRNMSKGYISVELKWVRSHTGSRSFLARGNDEADSLAKAGTTSSKGDTEQLRKAQKQAHPRCHCEC